MRFLLLFALLAALVAGQSMPSSEKPVVHELVLSGIYKDLPGLGLDFTSLLLGGADVKQKSFYGLVRDLEEVGKEGGGELLVDLSHPVLVMNLAQLAELERAFEKLHQAGVHTTAYLEHASMAHYLAASFCDRILMADMGVLDFASPALSVLYLKDALDFLGIQTQVTRAGRYKGAVEPYMRSSMSRHLREHYRKMLSTMNAWIVSRIARHRGVTAEQVEKLQADRLLSASEALAARLIDGSVAWRGARRSLGLEHARFEPVGKKRKKKRFSIFSLFQFKKDRATRLKEPSIAVLHLQGPIVDGTKKKPGSIVSGPTVKLIQKLAGNPKVAGVVVRVNSPGGSATASEAILLALRELARKKPMAVSMGEVAASGGYYISMVGAPVFAEHTTITGSIGVFGMRPNFGPLARRLGVRNEVVGLNDSVSFGDIFQPLGERQLELLQKRVDEIYGRFLERILEVRPLDEKTLLGIAGGRVWSGIQARDLRLVDHLGGLEAAAEAVRKKAGADLPLAHYPRTPANPLEIFADLLGLALKEHLRELRFLQQAGWDLEIPLQIIGDALESGSPAGRAWMLLPHQVRLF